MARPEPAGAGDQRDLRGELASLRKRLDEAEGYLGLDRLRQRRTELETEVSRSDLWDDPDQARRVTTEFSSVNADIEMLEEPEGRVVRRRGALTSSSWRRPTTRSPAS